MNITTTYTCCDKKYEEYIPIYVHSLLFHNDNLDIEIGVEDLILTEKTEECLSYIKLKYPKSKIKIKKVSFGNVNLSDGIYNVCPNVVRFITTPELVNDYVYITDIDIITLQNNFTEIHVKDMEKNGLNYSNIVRQNTKKLSGLHFSKWSSYYPIPDFNDMAKQGMLNGDEEFLYQLVSKSNIISDKSTFRPVHGIHMSPNRDINSVLGWGLKQWESQWIQYRNSDEFLFLEKLFTEKIKENVAKIDGYYNKTEQIFTDIYLNNSWKGSESKSGPGSSIIRNVDLLQNLGNFVIENNVKSIIDLGCGDFNWMKLFDFNLIEKYLGVDIVNEMILSNNKTYGNNVISFEQHDITNYPIEIFDIIICKDVLVHLNFIDALRTLTNIKNSKSTYFLSTTFVDFENININTGQWRPINLLSTPFNLNPPIMFYPNIEGFKSGWTNKGIGIWKIN